MLLAGAIMLVFVGGPAHAASTNDEIFANAALRELHNLAFASAQSERAAKDSDGLGCREAYDGLQKAGHEALTNMHQMSFAPISALGRVSSLLRVSNLSSGECPDDVVVRMNTLLLLAGQAIVGLRTDYAIGDGDWFTIKMSGSAEAKNPLRYAQSLSAENYSWVDVRPKGTIFIGVSDWKAEMASHDVGDPSIENSGASLKKVEVGYRKNSGDANTYVYFYRTREEAEAEARAAKTKAEDDAKAAAEAKASNAAWKQKFNSLPYLLANRDAGFKLTYAICKAAGKNAKGQSTCKDEGSHDWSESPAVPYRWFVSFQACDDAMLQLNARPPVGLAPGDFTASCVPAPKVSGRLVKGYRMVFALAPPGAESDENLYADLRDRGSQTASAFKTFHACYGAMDDAYSKTMKDLGADDDGTLLSDNTKSIDLRATCVRMY
jgi:hypothetical protein